MVWAGHVVGRSNTPNPLFAWNSGPQAASSLVLLFFFRDPMPIEFEKEEEERIVHYSIGR